MTEIVGDGSSTEATKLVNLVDLANSLTYRHEISSLIQRGVSNLIFAILYPVVEENQT